jgi:peroxiredoxin
MTPHSNLLADQIAELKGSMTGEDPNGALAVFAAQRAALAQAGVPADVPWPGQEIPDADLLDVEGRPVTLYQLLDERPAVVVFYRGGWCPWCNLALRAYQQSLVPFLEENDVTLIALSPQKPRESVDMAERRQLTFVLASDPGNALAQRLAIVNPPPSEEARAAAKAIGVDVAGSNLDGTDNLPMPTTLIIDRDRVIRWVDVHPDYSMRSEPADIIAAVAENLL